MSRRQLDLLKKRNSQPVTVTVTKTFTSIHLLNNSPSTSTHGWRRQRRDVRRHVGPFAAREALNGIQNKLERNLQAKLERVTPRNDNKASKVNMRTLLQGVRGVTVAQDLINLMSRLKPGPLTLSKHQLAFLHSLLQADALRHNDTPLQESATHVFFSRLQDEWFPVLSDDFSSILNLFNLTLQDEVFMTRDINTITEILESYKSKWERQLKRTKVNLVDVFFIFSAGRRLQYHDVHSDIYILDNLIDMYGLDPRQHQQQLQQMSHSERCLHECPQIQEKYLYDLPSLTMTCAPSLAAIYTVLRVITKYPSVIQRMEHLPENLQRTIQVAVIRHDLALVLEALRSREVKSELDVALVCGARMEEQREDQQVLKLLVDYRLYLSEALLRPPLTFGTREKTTSTGKAV